MSTQPVGLQEGVLVPQWPAPAAVSALCSTRSGGVSTGPYAALNLGTHVGDDAAAVAANRARWAERVGARPVFLRQVHGTAVAGLTPSLPDDVVEADGCVTTERGLACTILVADCLPVLLCDARGRAVAAAHAGWRGLAAGVIEATVERLRAALPAEAGADTGLLAWLGPCIGQDAYEVGGEVRDAMIAADPGCADCLRAGAPGKWHADLSALARRRLARAGVLAVHGNDGARAWCTASHPSVFFSHRRDRVGGRLAASIRRV